MVAAFGRPARGLGVGPCLINLAAHIFTVENKDIQTTYTLSTTLHESPLATSLFIIAKTHL